MARIPFRALGRPYAGKHGRFRNPAPVASASATPEPEVEASATPEPEVEASEPDPEPTLAQVLGTLVEAEPEPAPAPTPTWDASWTKAQLIVVAQSKGLSVTSSNTKADILAALTAAG
ncbi:MAG: hypothetical protein EBT79_02485 [Actinobacteria bacterium]|nr:hypothetical protein [Actinomycetota bacterium]NBR66143.1 hypothetical protein [Actinomycetota bacterium]